MKVVHRLYLMVTPAVVAMLLLAGLAYWGQYQRTAPEQVTIIGAVVVVASLVLSWANARYVAVRLERLVTGGAQRVRDERRPAPLSGNPRDELEEIERVVDQLSGAVATAASAQAHQAELFERRAVEYARLLAAVSDTASRQLADVRLPLHILLENRFGELNENQEEMLGAARSAAELLDADIVSVRQIAELDLGEHPLRRDRVKPAELIDAIRPMLVASAESAGVTIEIEIAPLLPAITGDRARLQDAMVTIVRAVLASARPESRIGLTVERADRTIAITIAGGGEPYRSIRWAVAVRIIQSHGGAIETGADRLTITVPTA
ncbi:MAG: histidine kinase [Gemmatimonadetes bacterium]|nr:histidine kinase [Gemmatimonadota bacterium]